MDFIMIIFHHFLRAVSDAHTFQFWSRVRDPIRCYSGKSVGQSIRRSIGRSGSPNFFKPFFFSTVFLAKFNINEIKRTIIRRYMKPFLKPIYCDKMANWSINLTIYFLKKKITFFLVLSRTITELM